MIHIYTGDGKGKTTTGVGLCTRCLGHNKKVAIFQFMKTKNCGEYLTLNTKCDFYYSDIEFGFVFNMTDEEKEVASCSTYRLFEEFSEKYAEYDVILLDEIISAVELGFVNLSKLVNICEKFKNQERELILTGRNVPNKLIEVADYVSEIISVKHPYEKGIPARKGIEY